MEGSPNPIVVRHLGGDRLEIEVGSFRLIADQPVKDGGDGTGPSPTELFLSGLAACVAFFAQRFLRRHELSTAGLTVSCDYGWAENPHRIGEIDLKVDAPSLKPDLHEAFVRVIEHCTLHSTLQRPPDVRIAVTAGVAGHSAASPQHIVVARPTMGSPR